MKPNDSLEFNRITLQFIKTVLTNLFISLSSYSNILDHKITKLN
jgi:hypothetical protein